MDGGCGPMAERTLTMFVGRLRGLLTRPGDSADAELLGRFVATRDETAFAELVRRHGGMVFGVCRRVLNDGDAAEDAFQATFLVLAQKAEALGRGTVLAAWLFGVAFRTALKARTAEARRRHYERVAGAEALRSPGRGVEHSAPATQTEAM